MDVPILTYKTKEELYNDFDRVKATYVANKIVSIRGLSFSEPEQEKLTRDLGDVIGWFPNNLSPNIINKYTESHSQNTRMSGSDGKKVILDWHIEHVDYDAYCPLVAGLWNMWKFNCEPGTGLTYFVDTTKVYALLDESEKQFLLDSEISWTDSYGFGPHYGVAAVPHWLTSEPTIRVEITLHVKTTLHSYKGSSPSEADVDTFNTIHGKIMNIIENNLDLRHVYEWQQGDILIPDLFSMAHAVTGGFDPKDRSFTGHWLFSKDPSSLSVEERPYAWR